MIGLGRSDRRDDGVGPAVVRHVESRLHGDTGVQLLTEADPTALLDLWTGHDHVVVVDAVVTGDPAGTIHRLDLGAAAPPAAEVASNGASGGTHGLGLAEVAALGRVLHRLPSRVVVIGVEADRLEVGVDLSPPVAAAVEEASALVRMEVAGDVPGRAG